MTEHVECESLEEQLHGRTIIILRVVVVVVGGRGGGGWTKNSCTAKTATKMLCKESHGKQKEQVLSTNQDFVSCTLRIFFLEPSY